MAFIAQGNDVFILDLVVNALFKQDDSVVSREPGAVSERKFERGTESSECRESRSGERIVAETRSVIEAIQVPGDVFSQLSTGGSLKTEASIVSAQSRSGEDC